MKHYKFQLSPTQKKNLQNVVLQDGTPLFPENEIISCASDYDDTGLYIGKNPYNTAYENQRKNEEITQDSTEGKIIEGIIFGISATLILTFVSAIIILITNLLNY